MDAAARERISDLVRVVIERRYGTQRAFARTTGVGRTTLHRIQTGVPLRGDTYRRLENALGLPADLLRYTADADEQAVRRCALDPDLERWLLTRFGH